MSTARPSKHIAFVAKAAVYTSATQAYTIGEDYSLKQCHEVRCVTAIKHCSVDALITSKATNSIEQPSAFNAQCKHNVWYYPCFVAHGIMHLFSKAQTLQDFLYCPGSSYAHACCPGSGS